MIGPYFKFEDVGATDFESMSITDADTVMITGNNVRITAKIEKYDSNQGIIYLFPVDLKLR